jgi:hypothetical protein
MTNEESFQHICKDKAEFIYEFLKYAHKSCEDPFSIFLYESDHEENINFIRDWIKSL